MIKRFDRRMLGTGFWGLACVWAEGPCVLGAGWNAGSCGESQCVHRRSWLWHVKPKIERDNNIPTCFHMLSHCVSLCCHVLSTLSTCESLGHPIAPKQCRTWHVWARRRVQSTSWQALDALALLNPLNQTHHGLDPWVQHAFSNQRGSLLCEICEELNSCRPVNLEESSKTTKEKISPNKFVHW